MFDGWIDGYTRSLLVFAGINVIAAFSFYVPFKTGQISLGQAGFPLVADHALDLVSAALATVETGGATTALRCGGPADWPLVLAAGPQRMNRLVVQQAAAGLARYLLDTDPRARERGVVIGYDARRKSDLFAADTARVMAAAGIRAMLFDQRVPTPVLAWSISELDAAAGVVVTASHNPPADNGYKVYLGDGAQIVPPHDIGIAACIDQVDPTAVTMAAADDALIDRIVAELGQLVAEARTAGRRAS